MSEMGIDDLRHCLTCIGACQNGLSNLEDEIEEHPEVQTAAELWLALDDGMTSDILWLIDCIGPHLEGYKQDRASLDSALCNRTLSAVTCIRAVWAWEKIEPALVKCAAVMSECRREAEAFADVVAKEASVDFLPEYEDARIDDVEDVWNLLGAGSQFRVLVLFERELNIDLQGRIKEELDYQSEIASQVLKLYDADWEQPPDELCILMGEHEIYLANAAEIEVMWREEFARRERAEMEEKSKNAELVKALDLMDATTRRINKLRGGLLTVSNRLKLTVRGTVSLKLVEHTERAGMLAVETLHFDPEEGIFLWKYSRKNSLQEMKPEDVLQVTERLPEFLEAVMASVRKHVAATQPSLEKAEAAMQKVREIDGFRDV